MNKILGILLVCLIISCGKKEHDLTVKGHIEGLKKGTIYLKKASDSGLVNVDSLVISGNPNFELHSALESPEVYFLFLDRTSKKENAITFFADKGITEINTTLKNFALDAKINGSKQQKIMEDYKSMIHRFNGRDLDLLKEKFEAQIAKDPVKLDSLQKESDNVLKRKYLFTVNFALNNKDSEVAPYLALTEIYNAKTSLLDTINVSLTEKVKTSKYGKELQAYLDDIKSKK